MKKNLHIETLAVQAGWEPKNGEPRVAPIAQSTTFKYDTAEELAKLFDLEISGHFYTRLSNPTVEVLEKKMAALEGGVGAIACSSGQSATSILVTNLCEAGDHIVSAGTIYGGTSNLLGHSFKKLGIETTFVDQDASEEEIFAAVRPNTKLIFGESLSNPSVKVLDFEKFASVARRAGVPFAVDNTFPTPYLCRPFDYGANIVIHSLSKYADGHACSLGGIVIDKGDFDYSASDKFPGLTTPDESYHGLVYTKAFGNLSFITKARTHVMRDFGMMMSPMNAWLTNMNLETLPLRMQKHSENGMSRLGRIPRPEKFPERRACEKIPESMRRSDDVRAEGRKSRRGKTFKLAGTRGACNTCCRHPHGSPPPGEHNPQAAFRRGTKGNRYTPRTNKSIRGARAHRRHYRGFRASPRKNLTNLPYIIAAECGTVRLLRPNWHLAPQSA